MNEYIEMKINRYIKRITNKDVILDNGACIQVLTQPVRDGSPLIMSRKQFKDLCNCKLICVDTDLTNKAIDCGRSDLTYYRFNIDRLRADIV